MWVIIDGFNHFHRNISSEVKNTADGLMISILFWATPKGDLSHYYNISRKTEPLGMELKHVECSMLGNMLDLEIQNGKQTTETSEFQQDTRGTVACTKRLMTDKKGVVEFCQTTPTFLIYSSVE